MKRLPAELRHHKQYPIFKEDARNGYSVVLNDKEAISIQSNNHGQGDGFRFRHFKSRGKILDILRGKSISVDKFKIESSRLIGSYLRPLMLIAGNDGFKKLIK